MRFALVLALAAATSQDPQSPPEARRLEEQILAQRNGLARGQVTLESTLIDKGTTIKTRRVVSFDGKKIRGDVIKLDGQKSADRDDAAREINCFGEKDFIFYNDESPDGGRAMGINVTDLKFFRNEDNRHSISDPRLLGLAPADVALHVYYKLNSLIVGSGKEPRKVEAAEHRGLKCWLISRPFAGPGKAELRLWIAPEKGMSVVRAEFRVPLASGKELVDSVESEVVKLEGSATWYPKSCHYRRTEGGEVTREQHVAVTSAKFNAPVDATVFTLAGMEVPVGKRILTFPDPSNSRKVWDGHRVTTLVSKVTRAQGDKFRSGGTFLAASGVFLVLAAGAGWRAYARGEAIGR